MIRNQCLKEHSGYYVPIYALVHMRKPQTKNGAETVSDLKEVAMSTFGYRKRGFLASISTGHTSYILTEVESSRGGEYKWGHCMLTMADCRRRIQLEFFLGTLRARRESLRKIDLLIKQLEQFRTALRTEAGLIKQYETKHNTKPRKSKRVSKKRAVSNGRTNKRSPSADL